MTKDRKTTIADAVLDLLAAKGARGLTHRAVDEWAGLPDGSTSSCCRKRLDLVTLALNRHAMRNLDELGADAERLLSGEPSIDRAVDLLVDRLEDWMSPAKRSRVVAQIELFLMASREPSLQKVVEGVHQHFVNATVQALQYVGVADADDIALGLIATVDGILYGQVVSSQTRPDRKTLRATLLRAVQAH